MVCPAQLRVILLAPMMRPDPEEQGPMFAVKVVLVLIVAPHTGLAKTGGKERLRVEPNTVRISKMLRRIGIGFKENTQTIYAL